MYIGRFAPSPTGPLHMGSLVSALASYLDARSQDGQWHLRIEDVDTPRTVAGAADDMIQTLIHLGFHWDGPVVHQSQRDAAYAKAFQDLKDRELVYPCACTRKEIADSQPTHLTSNEFSTDGAPVYPGTCRHGLASDKTARAWRMRVDEAEIYFDDHGMGPQHEALSISCGDFVLLRADGLWAYQLAVVVDDAALGVTHVVRGADLLASTARQIYLQQCLGYATPHYWHVPLVLAEDGEKLSKQNGATALELRDPVALLNQALYHFGIAPCPVDSLAAWWPLATARWAAYRQMTHSKFARKD